MKGVGSSKTILIFEILDTVHWCNLNTCHFKAIFKPSCEHSKIYKIGCTMCFNVKMLYQHVNHLRLGNALWLFVGYP